MTSSLVQEPNGFHAVEAAEGASSRSLVAALETSLEAARASFAQRNPTSFKLHQEALQQLPGGNTRSLLFTAPFPIYIKAGSGHKVFDEDGHDYVDFVGELTAGLYGHSHPVIQETLISTITNIGLNLGATTEQESKYAALLCSRFNLERIRFANTGTEANLHVLNAARRFTGKSRVVVFKGGYHGAVLSFPAPRGFAPNNVDKDDWVVAEYNNIESATAAITQDNVAAVIIEGMQGAGGCIPGTQEFLTAVQDTAKKAGVLFILDEVMTSRLAPGGLQSTLSLKPDLTSLGKYLGGGLSFGAFGGRADIMSVYDPRQAGHLMHNGTFNNNTLTMHAGYTGLSRIYTPEACLELNAAGDAFREKLNAVAAGTKLSFTGLGSILSSHVSQRGIDEVRSLGADVSELVDLKDLLWMHLLEHGFWITRRGTMAIILGTPQSELDRLVEVVAAFVAKHAALFKLEA